MEKLNSEKPTTSIGRLTQPGYNESPRPYQLMRSKVPVNSRPWFVYRNYVNVRGIWTIPYGSGG